MIKIRPKLYSSILALTIISGAVVSVLMTENEKNLEKAQALETYYSEIYNNWNSYKTEYTKQVEELKQQNRNDMATTQKNYETLLAQQPAIIEEHTRTIEQTSYVPQKVTTQPASSTNVTQNKQTISVKRPASKPTTGAS